MEKGNVDFDVIHVYTRAQAIEDGILVDITDIAWDCGLVLPCCMTVGIACAIEQEVELPVILQEFRRLIFTEYRHDDGNTIKMTVKSVTCDEIDIYLVIHPDDTGLPVLTLMLFEDM
jgi:hypothetical protein